jgi:hypothetical protein
LLRCEPDALDNGLPRRQAPFVGLRPKLGARLFPSTTLRWPLIVDFHRVHRSGRCTAAENCEALRAQIESKIGAAGVTRFAVLTVDANAPAAGQVVGSCELGTKKIVYQREAGSAPAPAPALVSARTGLGTRSRSGCRAALLARRRPHPDRMQGWHRVRRRRLQALTAGTERAPRR